MLKFMKQQLGLSKPTLRERFNRQARRLKQIGAIIIDTARDLRRPVELGMVAAAVFVPGGFIAYGVYRIKKYKDKRQKAANDLAQQAPRPAVFFGGSQFSPEMA